MHGYDLAIFLSLFIWSSELSTCKKTSLNISQVILGFYFLVILSLPDQICNSFFPINYTVLDLGLSSTVYQIFQGQLKDQGWEFALSLFSSIFALRSFTLRSFARRSFALCSFALCSFALRSFALLLFTLSLFALLLKIALFKERP